MKTSAPLRAVAFADAEATLWGLVLEVGGHAIATVRGAAGAGRNLPVRIDAGAGAGDRWLVQGEDLELEVEPTVPGGPEPGGAGGSEPGGSEPGGTGAPEAAGPRSPESGGPDSPPAGNEAAAQRLCRLSGALGRADEVGAEATVGSLQGTQTVLPQFDASGLAAVRLVTAHFPEGAAYALAARRPRRAKGHDREVVEAQLLQMDAARVFEEPRLSSTSTPQGELLRVGLELWLSVDDEEQEATFPHRLAGEVDGEPQRAQLDALDVALWRLRCHGRGREGWGLYAQLTPR